MSIVEHVVYIINTEKHTNLNISNVFFMLENNILSIQKLIC